MKSFIYKILITIVSLDSTLVLGQELDLFQQIENGNTQQLENGRPQRSSQSQSTPAFTLVGISRFGDKYFISLNNRDGGSVTVKYDGQEITNIDGYRGFRIAGVKSRMVSIRNPDSDPCIENLEKGVKCMNGIAVLTFANGTPIKSKVKSNEILTIESSELESITINEGDAEVFEDSPDTIPGTNVLRRNPFTGELQTLPDRTPEEEAERNRIRAERAERFRNFEVVRIPDNEIPEGMQRVRTPFGDSLEPIED
jgi:hypothetical protein